RARVEGPRGLFDRHAASEHFHKDNRRLNPSFQSCLGSFAILRRMPALFTRNFKKQFPLAVRGEGVWLWDSSGKKYLDLAGSAAVNFIGHGVKEIGEAMAAQAASLEFVHSSQFITETAENLARQILDFAGENFQGGAVYFTCGGSEAVETALKLARQYQVEIGQP